MLPREQGAQDFGAYFGEAPVVQMQSCLFLEMGAEHRC